MSMSLTDSSATTWHTASAAVFEQSEVRVSYLLGLEPHELVQRLGTGDQIDDFNIGQSVEGEREEVETGNRRISDSEPASSSEDVLIAKHVNPTTIRGSSADTFDHSLGSENEFHAPDPSEAHVNVREGVHGQVAFDSQVEANDEQLLPPPVPVDAAVAAQDAILHSITKTTELDDTNDSWQFDRDDSFDALLSEQLVEGREPDAEQIMQSGQQTEAPSELVLERDIPDQAPQVVGELWSSAADDDFFSNGLEQHFDTEPAPSKPLSAEFPGVDGIETINQAIDIKSADNSLPIDSHSLWEGMFADDEVMLEESLDSPFAATLMQGLPTTSESAQGMSWNDMTNHVVPATLLPQRTAESQAVDVSWNDAQGFDDFLSDSRATDAPGLSEEADEKPTELSWDNAFADDDDFMAGFENAATQDPMPISTDVAAGGTQTARSRSSSARQSYIPAGQAPQVPAAAIGGRPRTFSAVPEPELPVQNTVESSVRATSSYASPYDMPEDFAKPLRRKRTSSGHTNGTHVVVPPPASVMPKPPVRMSSLPPSSFGQEIAKPQAPSAPQQGFFEDLPVVARQRSSTPNARYSPQAASALGAPLPPPGPSKVLAPSASTMSNNNVVNDQHASAPIGQYDVRDVSQRQPAMTNATMQSSHSATYPASIPQLQAPAKLGPYADDQDSMRATTASLPPASTRYSPAPASAPTTINQNKYNQVGSRPVIQQYAPRTSSPLSYQSISQNSVLMEASNARPYSQPSLHQNLSRSQSQLEPVQENATPAVMTLAPISSPPQAYARSTISPPPKSGPPSTSSSPRKRGNYVGNTQSAGSQVVPPRRSQTSSPNGFNRAQNTSVLMIERPSSAQAPPSFTRLPASSLQASASVSLAPRLDGPQGSQLISPHDERAADPLQRWRGNPVLSWGSGGKLVTAFPTYLPRYISGQAQPLLQPGGGHFKVQNVSHSSLLATHFVKFPGPLKKNKKRELLAWLHAAVDRFQKDASSQNIGHAQPNLDQIKFEERVLLYKVLALVVEHDGVLDGNNEATNSIKQLLSQPPSSIANDESSTAEPTIHILPDAAASVELGPLRLLLKTGEAEKAVWHAVDQRLWGPAFLISSTLSKDIWKQVIQEFVRKEVRDKALAALFQVFAGNWDESVDELVSVSARAGFQMINTTAGTTDPRDAWAGLEQWRETVLLILSNRSPGDSQALVAIGRVLAGYGRFGAAHICFVFAGLPGLFGGSEEPNAAFSLVGGDSSGFGHDFNGDIEAILLSEVYEYVLNVSPVQSPSVPHLQAYKLYHAEILAENGLRTEAQQYCDSINSTIHSKTNRSPYYNVALMQSVDTLHKRLSETPVDSSSSWKPSIDKVSSSLWGKFNSFVAGEEKIDSPVNGNATPPDGEQFQRFAGNTPPISGSPVTVSTDLYNVYQSGATESIASRPPPNISSSSYASQRASSGTTNSRYHPNALSSQSRNGTESPQRTQDNSLLYSQSLSPRHETPTSTSPSRAMYQPYSTSGPLADSANNLHKPVVAPAYEPHEPTYPTYKSSAGGFAMEGTKLHESHSEVTNSEDSVLLTSDYGQPGLPPQEEKLPSQSLPSVPQDTDQYSHGSYQYQPYNLDDPQVTSLYKEEANDLEDDTGRKKKFFMDDDDDAELMKRVAMLKKEPKPSTTREPDDAVRRAAEADAARPPPTLNHKSSWFGGLGFFGKKQADLADPKKPVKANLGEKSSFVFDPELKKWVNKAAGAAAVSTPSATPPPPRSFPSRSSTPTVTSIGTTGVPGSMGPPRPNSSVSSAPPMSRSTSMQATELRPPTSSGPSPAPPMSRPGTAMSNASDIDDLLGAAGPRSRGAAKPKKKGRYVDVMAKNAA